MFASGRIQGQVFDVGANVGNYAREAREALGSEMHLQCFEPSPSAYQQLERALCDAPNTTLHNLGFSDSEGTADLYSPAEASKLGSLYDIGERVARVSGGTVGQERVRLTTIDRFCGTEGVEQIALLKLDTEGSEFAALQGASGMLTEGRIAAIQFEFSAVNVFSRVFFHDFFTLLSPRFSLYRVLQRGLDPVPSYREADEVFKRATNYLALRK